MMQRADPRTLGWLQRALTHEMRAVQQYLAQSVLARLWGEDALAEEFRREVLEELVHAERLMEELIRQGIAPAASPLPPARLGRRPVELIAADQQLEAEAVQLYEEAARHARRMRDERNAALFAELLAEEIHHFEALTRVGNGGRHDKGS